MGNQIVLQSLLSLWSIASTFAKIQMEGKQKVEKKGEKCCLRHLFCNYLVFSLRLVRSRRSVSNVERKIEIREYVLCAW